MNRSGPPRIIFALTKSQQINNLIIRVTAHITDRPHQLSRKRDYPGHASHGERIFEANLEFCLAQQSRSKVGKSKYIGTSILIKLIFRRFTAKKKVKHRLLLRNGSGQRGKLLLFIKFFYVLFDFFILYIHCPN